MNPEVPPLDLTKTQNLDRLKPHTPPVKKTIKRDKIARFSPRNPHGIICRQKKQRSYEKKPSRKHSCPQRPTTRKSSEEHKSTLSPRSPRVHISKTGKLFTSEKVKSARNLLLLSSGDKVKTAEEIRHFKKSLQVKTGDLDTNQTLIFMKTGKKTILAFVEEEEKDIFLEENKSSEAQEFLAAYIQAMTNPEQTEQFFKDLSLVICDHEIKHLVIDRIIRIVKDPVVITTSGRKISEFLIQLNRYNLEKKACVSRETLNREDSVPTRLMTAFLKSRLEALMERSIKRTLSQLKKLPERALYPKKPEFTKRDAKKLETALNTLLKDTLKEVKKIDLTAQSIFRKIYMQAGNLFEDESVGREQIVGSFFLRLLSPFLIAKESEKKDPNPRWLKANILIANLLHKTLLKKIDMHAMDNIAEPIQALFNGSRYKKRQDRVQKIIEHVVGIYPGDWTLTKKG